MSPVLPVLVDPLVVDEPGSTVVLAALSLAPLVVGLVVAGASPLLSPVTMGVPVPGSTSKAGFGIVQAGIRPAARMIERISPG